LLHRRNEDSASNAFAANIQSDTKNFFSNAAIGFDRLHRMREPAMRVVTVSNTHQENTIIYL